MSTPFIEVIKYVELENKRKKTDRWNGFLDSIYSRPDGVDKRKRQKYIEMIQPEKARKKLAMKTDKDQLMKIAEEQKRKAELKKNAKPKTIRQGE